MAKALRWSFVLSGTSKKLMRNLKEFSKVAIGSNPWTASQYYCEWGLDHHEDVDASVKTIQPSEELFKLLITVIAYFYSSTCPMREESKLVLQMKTN